MDFGKCVEPSGSVWNLQSFQVDVRVEVLRVQHNACGWMRISNMSRISVFNLSFEIRAKTTEKNYGIFGVALLVLHTRCDAFTEFCLRYEKILCLSKLPCTGIIRDAFCLDRTIFFVLVFLKKTFFQQNLFVL